MECQVKSEMAAFDTNIKSTYSSISPPQIGRRGGGYCIFPACKYFAVISQEFEGVNCSDSYYFKKTQLLEADD